MTYPIIRWNGGGGGAVGNNLAIKLGRGLGDGFFTPLLLPLTVDGAAVSASILRARDSISTESGSGPTPPSEATINRCACVMGLAGDVPPDLMASALEACHADPENFIAALGTSGLDTSSCSGASGGTPFYQNPWVLGGAAALVLGGLAYVTLK
jgi:hypothetical protein